MSNFLGAYIHIPFCSNICSYCDFSKVYYNETLSSNYLKSLEQEIKKNYQGEPLNSIYIGGGTPTSLNYQELDYLLSLTKYFNLTKDYEFTIETNIDCLDEKKIQILKKYGVNRVSLGVQSFDRKCLQLLNRTHTQEQALDIIKKLQNNGLDNINIDLIYGIINDIKVVETDLQIFLSLNIPHVSCYSLIIEPHTALYLNNYSNISEDIEYKQYNLIEKTLTSHGYKHYEISNYAKENYFSKHNLNYWNNGSYYGFGLSSTGYLHNYRLTNTRNLTKYLKGDYLEQKNYEDKDLQMSNTMILGLRKLEGVNLTTFQNTYQEDIFSVYDLDNLILDKLLIITNNHLKINPQYLYLSNEILLNFLERKS